MCRPAPARDRAEPLARRRIRAANVEAQPALAAAAPGTAAVQDHAPRLPGPQPLGELLRISRRIRRQLKRLHPQHARRGVVPVGPPTPRGKARHDHVRTKLPDDPHDVAQHLPPIPEPQCLLGRFGIAEVDRAGEELDAAVELARLEQFLGAGHAELGVELGADLVLPAVAPRQRKVAGAVAARPGEVGDQVRVLVIRVGGDVQQSSSRGEACELLAKGGTGGGFPADGGTSGHERQDQGGEGSHRGGETSGMSAPRRPRKT